MDKRKSNTEKLCSFYISDWHLVTMILPYINKELNEKANIVTILEDNIEKNIKILLTKLNLKNEKRILDLDWKKVNNKNATIMQNKLKGIKQATKNVIIVQGSKEYIEMVNNYITETLNLQKESNISVKIVDCYEVTDFNGNIKEILDKHNRILNTGGEKAIEDVFEGYTKIDSAS